ncbi:MAG: HlyD family secretion protein [Rhodanobacteraceae bacterium]|nr:HlyD family secretion protein [Rhodanobacteraceae bacterium]HPF72849.1 HlyD family secretion protein [Xanthomonadaceae bacterium]HRX99090.1 HlyD family secretion protein [Xanthomonadaceae bacterium]
MSKQQEIVVEAKRGRRSQRILWIAGPLLVLSIAAYVYLFSGRYAETDNAYVKADVTAVATQIDGRVVEVAVHQNQRVSEGDLLFRLDPEPLRIAVAEAQAGLASTVDAITAARDEFHQAEAALRSADTTLDYAGRELKRQHELRGRGLVAQQAEDNAEQAWSEARARRDSARAAQARARSLLGGDVAAETGSLPSYRAAAAKLAQAELDLAHAELRAPSDGIVGSVAVKVGEYIHAGEAALPLVASDHPWVEANLKETELANVAVGQSAEVRIDAYPGRVFQATVASISPASGAEFSVLPAQNATGNWVKVVQRVPVRLRLLSSAEDAPVLRAGMSAVIRIDTGARNSVFGRWFGGDDGGVRQTAASR